MNVNIIFFETHYTVIYLYIQPCFSILCVLTSNKQIQNYGPISKVMTMIGTSTRCLSRSSKVDNTAIKSSFIKFTIYVRHPISKYNHIYNLYDTNIIH